MSEFDRDQHFDEMTCLLLLEGQLETGRAREVSMHLEACGSCRRLCDALESESVWLRESLGEEEPIPAGLLASPHRGGIHWGPWSWIAALGLGFAGAYTFWSGVIQPSLDQASQAGFSQDSLLALLFFSSALWKGWDAMSTTMELFAACTLGVVGFWLLRRQWRRFTPVAAVMGALALVLSLSPAAGAAEIHRGQANYTLPAGQQTSGDLIVTAARTRIDGDVNGDLIVFSENVTVNGHVKGDILGFVQDLRVNGTVDGNIRGGFHSLFLNGSVARNISALTENFDMDGKAAIGGSASIFSNDAELDGRIGGDLRAAGNSITIDGSLARDAEVRAQRFAIGSEADIKGSTLYRGARQPDVSSGAKLGSPVQATIEQRRGRDYSSPRFYVHQILFWGAVFIFGLLMLLVAPGFFFDVTAASKRVAASLGWGAVVLIVTPVAAVAAIFTIVGAGVGIAAILCYLIALFAAQVFVGAWLGETMLGSATGVGAAAGRLALGLAVIRLVSVVPVLGGLVQAVVIVWGLGALAKTVHRRMRSPMAAAAV